MIRKLILAFGVKQLVRPSVVCFRNEHLCQPIQITIIR